MYNVGNSLRKRYVLALSIIVILLIVSQIVVQFTIQDEASDSRIVNIAGRQRMLSQRINKCIFGLLNAQTKVESSKYMTELDSSVLLWERSHNGLQYGDKELGLPGNNSAKIMALFEQADPYYQKILKSAKDVISIGAMDKEQLMPYLQIVKDNEQNFLKIMDAIAFQYDLEAKNKIIFIRIVEMLLMLFTLFVLAMEARFIFIPAEISVQKSFMEIAESHENMLKLFEIAPAALFLLEPPGLKIIEMNGLAENYIRKNINNEDLLLYFQENLESDIDIVNKMIDGESFANEEAVLKSEDSIKALLISSSKILYQNKASIIVSMMDISRQKHAESILRRYASVDELTGLLNRRSGKNIMDNAIDRANREKQDLTVCFADIDGLKYVNDNLGHDEGDSYIIAVAEAIKSNLREEDFAFRYGGDEIIIILNSCNEEKAEMIIKRINNSIEQKKNQGNKLYNMSISIGVASLFSKESTTSDDLIVKADNLMYEEKRRKKAQRMD